MSNLNKKQKDKLKRVFAVILLMGVFAGLFLYKNKVFL